ncbi:uncharacterized protein N0V89_002883 [Didymosphaeria variabile]|uniref:Peptidase A2 domain-containing protein n=1 Tax=Didymosphaeria variabile TaxID=1932322 RepID=A0A9W8XTC0_9PLEO|nr:uncharacterized protein N0V89_002883 [Didymosphaeria variabile]KAJ4358301.1 hypothetical protein N0V89_002883 [Didymosphaeria variabile]
MADAYNGILAACSSGDIPTLKALFQELQIASNHPQSVYSLDRSLPEEQQVPVVERMFLAAIQGEQAGVIAFLSDHFAKVSLYGYPMRAAIDTGNTQVLRAACKADPKSADAEIGDDECINPLGYAASKKKGVELIKVLLDGGADPNTIPPFRLPQCWNVSAAVLGGLPISTFEQFFDAGYQGNDHWAVNFAVEKKRADVLEVLFARGKKFSDARFPPEKEMIDIANIDNDVNMVAAIKRAYATLSKRKLERKPGLVASLIGKLRSRV